jgi:hypothetical protein
VGQRIAAALDQELDEDADAQRIHQRLAEVLAGHGADEDRDAQAQGNGDPYLAPEPLPEGVHACHVSPFASSCKPV